VTSSEVGTLHCRGERVGNQFRLFGHLTTDIVPLSISLAHLINLQYLIFIFQENTWMFEVCLAQRDGVRKVATTEVSHQGDNAQYSDFIAISIIEDRLSGRVSRLNEESPLEIAALNAPKTARSKGWRTWIA
jgi:hypothetical protein